MPNIIWHAVTKKESETVVDYSRAFDWYKKAAEQNDYRAMCCMGSYFLMGQGRSMYAGTCFPAL